MEDYESTDFDEELQNDEKPSQSNDVLEAAHIYLLMKKDYRISRNVRANWFFTHLNKTIEIGQQLRIEEFQEELGLLSVIPQNPPSCWSPETSRAFKYKILSTTAVSLLARRYRLVFCLDLSPSVMMVDACSGEVVIDKVIISLQKCLEGLTSPFIVPGSNLKFTPQLYVTVIVHTSSFILRNQQVLVHGWLLTADNVQHFLEVIQAQLNSVENPLAENRYLGPRQVSNEHSVDFIYDDVGLAQEDAQNQLTMSSPEISFVNLLRYGILALQLLPETSSAGIIMVSDGMINLPDVHLYQSLLAHLRNSTISCSFLHVGSRHQPGCCWGYESFPDLMRFIAATTYGAYIPLTLEESIEDHEKNSKIARMNAYHHALLVWSFQWNPYALKADFHNWSTLAAKGDAVYSKLYYSPNCNANFEKQQHLEKSINSSLYALMSCRLREGYGIRDVTFNGPDNDRVEVALVLPWKQDLNIVYLATSSWPPDASSCRYKVIVEGSYEFLHDLTCPAQKSIKSRYRCNLIKKFLENMQNLSQTDAILSHLHSFASAPAYYTIPDNIRSGLPLFYLSPGTVRPVICTSDFPAHRFAEFWEPICMLDINIWQKWMHTHRIEIILVHDKPFPKHLHLPNSNDRYAIVQCRQSLAALNFLLCDWSSFVLIENHSYIKFLFGGQDQPPVSFYIISVDHSKAPCMVIRLAFLGGMSSQKRNEIVSVLKEKILSLTYPSHPYMKAIIAQKTDTENNLCTTAGIEEAATSELFKNSRCCVQLVKPVEKILIRYEKTPNDYASPIQRIMPSRSYLLLNVTQHNTIGMFSTLGRYLYHRRWVWSAQSDLSSPISLPAVARILSTLVKVHLQKGFHVAHSCSGVISMALEVYMKGDANLNSKPASNDECSSKNEEADEEDTHPCVVQHIIFPPHSVSSVYESFPGVNLDITDDFTEHEELQLITECWVEPQHGRITKTNEGTQNLEGLTYKEVPKALYLADYDCISTMLTFEHLNLMCQSCDIGTPEWSSIHPSVKSPNTVKLASSSIYQIPFTFDLMRLLPKCQQAELLFSTLTQDFEIHSDGSMPNQLLLELLQNGVAGIHDREIQLSDVMHSQFLQFLMERQNKRSFLPHSVEELPQKSTDETPTQSDCNENEAISVARWKCFIKGFSPTHIVIMFIPETFKDLIKLNSGDHCWSDGNGDTMHTCINGKGDAHRYSSVSLSQSSSMGLKYVLPMYVYDCHLSGLIEQLVQKSDTLHLGDILQDHRPSCEIGEETATIRSNNQSTGSDSSKHTSPEPRTDEAETPSSHLTWKHHLCRASMVFASCFVSSVYQSLQRRFSVCCHDIQYAMEAICNETALVIDITEFLQTVCYHAKNWPSKGDSIDADLAIPLLQSWEFPRTFWSSFSCGTLQRVHDLIRTKFKTTTQRDFVQIASNQDYYYYYAPHVQKSSPLKSSCTEQNDITGDEFENSRGSVEFKSLEETGRNDNGLNKFRPSVDLESEEASPVSAISLTNSMVRSSLTDEDPFDEKEENDCPPLFIHLTCSIYHTSNVSNCSVETLPTCFRSVLRSAGFKEDQIDEMNPNELRITLDIICLTLPPEVIAVMGKNNSDSKKGVCSSRLPHDCTMDDCCGDLSHHIDDEFCKNTAKDPLGHLPKTQSQSINKYVEEIKWMLKDEKASFARDVHPITEDLLRTVASHITNSTSRPGCSANKVPLQFVFGPEQSLDKFIQEFHRMPLHGYQLIHEGQYYYLAIKRAGTNNQCTALQSSCLASKHLIVQGNPHQDDAAELRTLLHLGEDISKEIGPTMPVTLETSIGTNQVEENDDGYEDNDEDEGKRDEDTKGSALQKQHKHLKERRKHAGRMRGKNSFSKNTPSNDFQVGDELNWLTNDPVAGDGALHPEFSLEQHKHYPDSRERSSSTEEEINAICNAISINNPSDIPTPRTHLGRKRKRSVGTGAASTKINGNSTEDGYDGDSSDVDNDCDMSLDLEFKKPELPNFWLILHIFLENVEVFFQFRDAELDESQMRHRNDVNRQVILHIKNICKIVNQALLLQDLHDTRMCNQLLEPESSEDIWKIEDIAASISSKQGDLGHLLDAVEKERFVDCQDTYLEATMKFMPGAFSCPVVWEIQFCLHPRIKSGHGRNVPKVGIKALKTVLTRLSVNNRSNMFVYKEQNGGAVFYLRLHEIPPVRSHHPSDYSLAATRPSIAEDTLSLGSRSSSMQSLNVSKAQFYGNDDSLEANPRIIVQDKDREQSQDTLSLSSCFSTSRQKPCDDIITLCVHGICDTGSEIKEDLVQALQNRLDDAVLDVISLAFVRNPKCKLSPEDVQFLQRPGEPPKNVIHFSIQAQSLPFLQIIGYYLRQNLMHFLNTPVYSDNRSEYQFHRFHKGMLDYSLQSQEASTAFLYIRPQEAGNRGIACIILSIVDGQRNLVQHISCPRPSSCAYKDGLSQHEFECLTQTNLHESIEKNSSKSPGPVALIEFQIWEKGRVDMEQLTEKLRMTLRHALWDFVTEYRFLTAPIAEMPFSDDPPIMCSEPSTPLKTVKKPVPLPVEKSHPKERAASPLFTVQAYLRELSSSVPDLLQAKCKSPSWSSRGEYPFKFQPNSPPPVPTSAPYNARPTNYPAQGVDGEVCMAMDAEVLRKQEKYELGDKGVLHPFYSSVSEHWLEFGRSIGVTSIQKNTYNLTSRHSVELILRDLQSIICSLVVDSTPKVFKKEVDDFVPFHSLSIVREKKRVSGTPSLDGTRPSGILPGKPCCFCIIARNVRQWRISSGQMEKEGLTEIAESKEADAKIFSEYQKFQPFIRVTNLNNGTDNAARSTRVITGSVNTNSGIQQANRNDGHLVFIPRQRLLILFARDRQVSLFTYNWSSDKLNKLTDRSNKLVEWYNLRSCFLSSIVFQKLGLFLNQPVMRKSSNCKLHNPDSRMATSPACKCVSFDLEALTVSGGVMLRRDAAATNTLISPQQRRHPSSQNTSTISFYDVLRDNHPQRPMRLSAHGSSYSDPVVLHVGHFIETKNSDTRDRQKKLLLLWQDREARASIPISLLKQISRIEHYCLTPLLFHPLWRIQVATGRDPMLTGLPPSADKLHFPVNSSQQAQPALAESSLPGLRSRHSSGTSIKGPESRHPRKASMGTLVSIPSCPPNHNISRNLFSDEWHATMCSDYIGEFVQYLQTLGFVVSSHVRQSRPLQKIVNRGKAEASALEDQTNSNTFPQYLQKFLLGGILLLELVVYEPYFGVKIYSYESMRLCALSSRTLNAQFVVAFLDECDKMKVSMHLHSFTYDYHLRSMHSYISGRQLTLKRGYHIVGFLDDFLKYYQKSPNFARNLVHESHITISPTMTSAQQLFDYLLKYDRLYGLRAMRMISLDDGEEPEHILVQLCTRKVSYKDGSDIRQTDEFDVSVLVARETLQFGSHAEVGERYSLSLKFFIILTSCREMFPKPVVETPQGTFRAVSTTALPPSRPPSQPPSRRMSMDMERSGSSSDRGGSQKISTNSNVQLQLEKSADSKGEMSSYEQTDTTSSTLTNSMNSYDGETAREITRISGIRQEIVNYMGYFSTHEELMNNIMMEQVHVVRNHIQKVVDRAMVDCRKDYLWERLQKSNREAEESGRRKKEEAKDFLYGLTYAEFVDLLKLVERKTLTDLDPGLECFLNMPINWYQTLVKVLLNKYHDCHRHFTAPDGNTQHVAILNADLVNTFMLLSIDLHSNRTELCIVFRDPPLNISTNIYSFLEDFVNVCCFHTWTSIL